MADEQQFLQINPENFWIIETTGLEWFYLFEELLATLPTQGPETGFLMASAKVPTFYFNRQAVSAEQIAARVGKSAEQITPVKLLRLRPLVDESALPKPTVSYYGRG